MYLQNRYIFIKEYIFEFTDVMNHKRTGLKIKIILLTTIISVSAIYDAQGRETKDRSNNTLRGR